MNQTDELEHTASLFEFILHEMEPQQFYYNKSVDAAINIGVYKFARCYGIRYANPFWRPGMSRTTNPLSLDELIFLAHEQVSQ